MSEPTDLLPGGVFVSLLLPLEMEKVGMGYFIKPSNLTLQSHIWSEDYSRVPAG